MECPRVHQTGSARGTNEVEMSETNPTVVNVDDLAGLAALDKVLREAKFNPSPVDAAIAASPIVADLARKVRAAVNVRTFGESEPAGREDMIEPGWREWDVSLAAARRLGSWSSWGRGKQAEVARDLLSPFGVSDENLEVFLDEVDSLRPSG